MNISTMIRGFRNALPHALLCTSKAAEEAQAGVRPCEPPGIIACGDRIKMCRSFVQIVPLGAGGQCRVVGEFAGSLLLLPEFLQIHSHFMDDQAKQTARENGSQREDPSFSEAARIFQTSKAAFPSCFNEGVPGDLILSPKPHPFFHRQTKEGHVSVDPGSHLQEQRSCGGVAGRWREA